MIFVVGLVLSVLLILTGLVLSVVLWSERATVGRPEDFPLEGLHWITCSPLIGTGRRDQHMAWSQGLDYM
jgi:hypothetical protein